MGGAVFSIQYSVLSIHYPLLTIPYMFRPLPHGRRLTLLTALSLRLGFAHRAERESNGSKGGSDSDCCLRTAYSCTVNRIGWM